MGEVEMVDVLYLHPHPDNPREGDVGAIAESINANGWYGVIVAQVESRRILVGNHRWRAAVTLGIEQVPVMWLDVNDEQATRILIADNRTSDLATYDDRQLADLLVALAADDALRGTGYDGDDIDDLLSKIAGEGEQYQHRCPQCGHEFED